MRLGVWTPFRRSGSLGAPQDLPLGRAALALREEGVELVIGQPSVAGAMSGVVARPEGWAPCTDAPVSGVYDRFPSASQAEAFAAGRLLLQGLPLVNAPAITALCRDKWACQLALGDLAQPSVALTDFETRLADWGAAFLKPREGSFGRGVRRVVPGDALPEADGTWVMQRAVPPPTGVGGGLALRILVQEVNGAWVARPPVARISADDPVVNAARGAEVAPARDRFPLDAVDAACALARRAAERLEARGDALVELGVDVVFDRDCKPFLIEVNSRPRGRLRALAARWPERFAAVHTEACIAPFRSLVSVLAGG